MSWIESEIGSGRCNVNGFTYNGDIYSFGGFNLDELTQILKLDPTTMTTSLFADMPTERYNVVPCVIDGKFYAVGGRQKYDPVAYTNVLEVLDLATMTWSTKAPLWAALSDAAGVAIDGKFYVVGGAGTSGTVNKLVVYDPATDTWTTLANCPYAVNSHRAVAYNGKMYIFGGRATGYSYGSPRVYCYDPTTNTWERKADMPIAKFHVGAALVGNEILITGGTTTLGLDDPGMSNVEVYNPSADIWRVTDLFLPRKTDRHTVAAIGTTAYVMHGWGSGWFITKASKNDLSGVVGMEFSVFNSDHFIEQLISDCSSVLGTGNWYIDNGAMRSDTITHNEQTIQEFTLDVPEKAVFPLLSLKFKTSSQAGYDFFKVKVNGVVVLELSGLMSTWSVAAVPVEPGTNTIQLIYFKNGYTSSGSDCVWVDDIILKYHDGAWAALSDVQVSGQSFNAGDSVTVTGKIRKAVMYTGQVLDPETVNIQLTNKPGVVPLNVNVTSDSSGNFSHTFTADAAWAGTCRVDVSLQQDKASSYILIKEVNPTMIFTEMTLSDSYEKKGLGYTTPGYAADADGRLVLKGVVKLKHSSDNGAVIGYIDNTGLRTSVHVIVDCGDYRIAVDPQGYVLAKVDDNVVSDGFVMSLDGIVLPLISGIPSVATFDRESVAYDVNGAQVAMDVPKFKAGRCPAPVWQDTFDTDLLDQYTSTGETPATWSVSGGVLTASDGSNCLLLKKDLDIKDFELEVIVDQAARGIFVGRYQDINNYYFVSLIDNTDYVDGKGFINIAKKVNGGYTQLTSARIDFPRGTAKTVKMVCNGSTLEAWYDGVKVCSAIDTTITEAGAVGLRKHTVNAGSPVRILDFKVYQVSQGVLMEFYALNLLTVNQASIETDLSGIGSWSVNGQDTLTRDTSQFWTGTASAKLVSDAAVPQSMNINTSGAYTAITADIVYTFSAYAKTQAAVGRQWRMVVQWFDANQEFISQVATPLSLTTDCWTRLTATFAAPANAAKVFMIVDLFECLPGEILWVDGMQIEQWICPTSWQMPGVPRWTDDLTIPTAGILSPAQGTVEMVLEIDPINKHNVSQSWVIPFATRTIQPEPYKELNQVSIRNNPGTLSWMVEFSNSQGDYFNINLGDITVAGAYNIAFKWIAGVGGYAYLNGVLKGSVTAAYLPSSFDDPVIHIGSWDGHNLAHNASIYELRISSVARSDAEIAAAYNSAKLLHVDNFTTCKLDFNDNLLPTVW